MVSAFSNQHFTSEHTKPALLPRSLTALQIYYRLLLQILVNRHFVGTVNL
jgi:hypothetical protein